MVSINIVHKRLTDGSKVFALLIKNGEKGRLWLELPIINEEEVNRLVNEFHIALEKLLREDVTWGDDLGDKG